ncbi:hypothetical protein BDF20DRAFT_239344 [Mycotypha africana]|uniref:uncharacterized protein n=1 Tax=Mycotypha africana TaxID=64632 RepID=UPI002300E663|nr:uncharacterized protein BDF20DRAFT_239344 [Mycotypha africana]KAI8967265.1 hypothetical protein BDF20DRAFT_239344 [Mycotypha africana]
MDTTDHTRQRHHRPLQQGNSRFLHPTRQRHPNENETNHPTSWRSDQQRSQKEREDHYCHPDDRNGAGRKELFSRFLHPDVIERGLLNKTYIKGVLRLVRNPMDAYVTSEDLDHDIYISGAKNRNRALDGDMVAVELLDNVDEIWEERRVREMERFELRKKMREQDAAEKEALLQKQDTPDDDEDELLPSNDNTDENEVSVDNDAEDDDNDDDDDDDDDDEEGHKPKYCGRVVGIIERSPNITYSGTIVVNIGKKRLKPDEPNADLKMDTEEKNDEDEDDGNTSNSDPAAVPSLEAESPSTTTTTTTTANTPVSSESHPTEAPRQGTALTRPLRYAWFKPSDKRIPLFMLKYNDIPDTLLENEDYFTSHLFEVELRRWQITDRNPIGRFVKELGPLGDLMTEKYALLSDSCVIVSPFSPLALKCLPETPWTIPAQQYKTRRDLRHERVFSIDPKTAKDLDDALHIKALSDGCYEVGVHIADVSFFVKKGTVLDTEARRRATSTYLVDDVIPMLPPLLCEELCSLNPGVERLAFSVIWKMDKEGKPVDDTWFGKTIIKSCAKLAYEDAQRVIEGGELDADTMIHDGHNVSDVYHDIRTLQQMSMAMRKRRYENGSLSMNSVKLQFELDERGEPISVRPFEAKEANRMIEEFMLCANISVAQKIAEAFPDEALLRRHQEPIERRMNNFLKITHVLGLDFDGSTAGSLQASFDKIQNQDIRDVMLVLAIRTMQKAKYFCAGSLSREKYRHYALNEPLYTHFTSPIRRYADVIVHRMLESALPSHQKAHSPYGKKFVQKTAFHCNSKKDGARSAQDRSILLFLSHYLNRKEATEGHHFTKAVVIAVAKKHYEIYVPEYGLEKKVLLEGLPLSKSHFDKTTLALDLFWQRDVPVTMHNEEKIYGAARLVDDYSDSDSDSDADADADDADETDIEDSLQALTLKEAKPASVVHEADLIPPVVLEEATCRQQLGMFSSITVRIQVNNTRSPPIINIYPVSPFCTKTAQDDD